MGLLRSSWRPGSGGTREEKLRKVPFSPKNDGILIGGRIWKFISFYTNWFSDPYLLKTVSGLMVEFDALSSPCLSHLNPLIFEEKARLELYEYIPNLLKKEIIEEVE